MGLFTLDQISKINAVADKSPEKNKTVSGNKESSASTLEQISREVSEYFKDSPAILITTQEQLHDYISECIKVGYAGIDTETTGLDRVHDHIVGSSLYYPGGVECYIPNKHMVPVFDTFRPNQLTYEQCQVEFQRLVDANCKMIFANADYDIAMLYKDYKVDFIDACYYDVILAWRCIKEDEQDNRLKALYNKYVLGGKGDPKSFTDFFSPKNFPYASPEVAKLYAANDAKITYDLFIWQFPYINKNDEKCIKNHLESISDVVWNLEFPMIKVCALLHRQGIYFDTNSSKAIAQRYSEEYKKQLKIMQEMVQKLIDTRDYANNRNRSFQTGKDFNPDSIRHTQYLLYTLLKVPIPQSGKNKGKMATGKEVIQELNLPETNQLLKVRSLSTLIGTFTDKLPKSMGADHKIHSTFNSTGAATGRMSSSSPNLQNIPSHNTDIRHSFRADPSKDAILDFNVGDDVILLRNNRVCLEDNSYKFVKDLQIGDKIRIAINNSASFVTISSIENKDPKYVLKFDGDIVSSFQIPIKTSPMVIIGSDYSQQEPKICSCLAQDKDMIKSFQDGKDIYATIAGLAYGQPYEKCLEFHPETHAYQPDGKEMRGSAKTIVLGILYGRSVKTIGDQLYGKDKSLSDDDKTKKAQRVYDSVLKAFPGLRDFMFNSQNMAHELGYVTTITGRRRHIPEMMLDDYDFKPMPGYVNPDVDPLDPTTLANSGEIPDRIVQALKKEYAGYKYYGQIVKRNKELYEKYHIQVVNNTRRKGDASRECVNSRVQGSAADMTKMALIRIANDPRMKEMQADIIIPVHDEILIVAPQEYAEQAGEVLSEDMQKAGEFMPFPIKCDIEISYRWYGLSYPCPYKRPQSIHTEDPDEVKWIQYCLFEMEYLLPVFKDENGEKPKGDAAKGVNGIITDEMDAAIQDYMAKWKVTEENFIEDIWNRVDGYDIELVNKYM